MSKHIFWLSSYPKSGNTLIRSILISLFFTEDGIFNLNLFPKITQFEKVSLIYKNKNLFKPLFLIAKIINTKIITKIKRVNKLYILISSNDKSPKEIPLFQIGEIFKYLDEKRSKPKLFPLIYIT